MLRQGEYTTDYKKRVLSGDCTKAESYVCSLPDFDEKQCGDFTIEDIEKAYEAGFNTGKYSRNEEDLIPARDIEFLKKCMEIKPKEVSHFELSRDYIKVCFYGKDSLYYEYPSKTLLIKVNQLSYSW